MKVKFKKLNANAVLPSYGTDYAAGLDLTATSKEKVYHDIGFLQYLEYGTGLSVEIPEGHCGLIFPRSSISKYALTLGNSVGVIDEDYRGEITFRFKHSNNGWGEYNIGERIGQLIIIPYPKIEVVESMELSNTIRGIDGWGSTGK